MENSESAERSVLEGALPLIEKIRRAKSRTARSFNQKQASQYTAEWQGEDHRGGQ